MTCLHGMKQFAHILDDVFRHHGGRREFLQTLWWLQVDTVSECFRIYVVVLCLHFGSFTISLGHSPGVKSSLESYARLRTSRTTTENGRRYGKLVGG